MKRTIRWIVVTVLLLSSTAVGRAAEKPDLLSRALAGPLAERPEVVFTVSTIQGDGHYYANYAPYPDRGERCPDGTLGGYDRGGQICRLNLKTGKLKVIFDDPDGAIRDLQLHYSGEKALFAYRAKDSWYYHLYEINLDGTGLRQLTDGPVFDGEGCYLPDGDIVFASTRCHRSVACYFTPVATLYRCDADGGNIRPLSSGTFTEATPWMLPDGRLICNRWDYTDRRAVDFHGLWTMNPDGTNTAAFFGNSNEVPRGHCLFAAKPIPGTRKVVAVYHPSHGYNKRRGWIVVIDPRGGPDCAAAMTKVAPREKQPDTKKWPGGAPDYADPYPLAADLLLVTRNRNLLLVDDQGREQVVFSLKMGERNLSAELYRARAGKEVPFADLAGYERNVPKGMVPPLMIYNPAPLGPRTPEPLVPPKVDHQEPSGTMFVTDVYRGRDMAGVERGAVKKLLILEELPSAMRTGYPGSMPWETVWAFKGVVGTVPVEPDGSACFEAPAMRSLMFVLLDEDERAIKRMHSFVTLRPGETVGCVGCHERRTETPFPAEMPTALRRGPSLLDRTVHGPVDLMRYVQPILDKHCVKCHNVDRQDGGICLSADMATITRSLAYVTLREGGFLPGAKHIQSEGRDAPYAPFGSRFDGFDTYLSHEHHGVRLSREEKNVIWRWFDCGALYASTYAIEGMRGDSPHGIWFITRRAPTLAKNCLGCHKPEGKEPRNYVLKFKRPVKNLKHPEKSLLWLAPLPKEHGGLGLCKNPKTGRPTTLLADKNSETYRAIREDLYRNLGSQPCLGEEGFRPSPGWLGRMKQCGVVATSFDPQKEPYDPFALDQQYYQSQWCPLGSEQY